MILMTRPGCNTGTGVKHLHIMYVEKNGSEAGCGLTIFKRWKLSNKPVTYTTVMTRAFGNGDHEFLQARYFMVKFCQQNTVTGEEP